MSPLYFALPALVWSAPAAQQLNWQRYTQPTGLSAEFPGAPDRFDKWTSIAQGRVIQLDFTGRNSNQDFRSYYFLQAVIADKPYDIDAKIAEHIAQAKGGGDAAVSKTFVSQRTLKASEMPLPGMRGIELTYRYGGFFGSGDQIEVSRNMYLGNKWLSYSVRHFEGDTAWPRDRFFNSVRWAP
ncbi:hypothetical protein [Sphingomonas soli]|uniref:hypothetical protein n=1 Tax=Sphingomonas soli TaxID=266127 RepID=UPI000AEED512|nr:hypothetical protein [Sphingomonas soli]